LVQEAAPPPELLERCHRSYVESWWETNKWLPGARIERWSDGTAIGTSIPSELGNILFVMRPPDDAKDLLARARDFFSGAKPWRVIGNTQSRDALAAAIGASMKPKPGSPGMLLESIPEPPPSSASLRIERVSNPTQLSEFLKVVSKAERVPMFVLKRLFPHTPAETDPVFFFVGYEGEEPAASAVTVVKDGIAVIYTVGVRPRSRRRGYGQAITWAAIQAGRERGCDSSYLQASEMGLPVYKRMGFQVVSEYPEWHANVSRLGMVRGIFYFIGMVARGH
jgi:GNAT superfamily N-acetyltransferase